MNILLTSAGRRSYLVKYFKEALGSTGLVHAANSSSLSTAFLYADKTVITPLIYDENYIPFLLDYCKSNSIDAIISLFDVDLMVLAQNKELFAQAGVRVLVADEKAVDICNDKWHTYEFCVKNKINVPRTYINLQSVFEDIEKGTLSFPLYIKPRWGMGSLSVFRADNSEELRIFYKKSKNEIENSYLKYESAANKEECVLIQEALRGQEYGIDVINDLDGNYQNTVIRQKYAMRSGETDAAIIVKNESITDIGKLISRELRHPGNLDADIFLVNDTPYLLEMNARFGGGYPFSHIAGVNMPLAIIRWLCSEDVPEELLSAIPGTMAAKELIISKIPQEIMK